MQDTSPTGHSWFRKIQRETCSILQFLSSVVNKQLHSLHSDNEERQLLPSSFSSSCPNEFQTGFPYHTDTVNNVARRRVCPLSGYYCEQLKFFPSHSQAQGFILLNSFNQICSSTAVQSVSKQFLNWDMLPCHCTCCGGYGQQSPETYLCETLRDQSAVADNHLGEKTGRVGQAHHWAAHHCRMMHWPHCYAGFKVYHHSFIFTSDFHVTQNRA